MLNKKDNNKEIDPFSSLFKEKLEQYPLPVDDKCWDEIEQRMKPKSKRVSLWVAASAVAAILVAALLLIPLKENAPTFVSEEKTNATETVKLNNEAEKSEIKITSKPANNNSTMAHTPRKTVSAKNHGLVSEPNPIDNSRAIGDTVDLANVIIEIEKNDIAKDKKQDNQKTDSIVPKTEKSIQQNLDTDLFFTYNTNKKREKWSLAAAVSTGGYAPNKKLDEDMVLNGPNSNDFNNQPINSDIADTKDKENMYYEQMEGIRHLPPLSFQLMLSKKLNNRIGIETGLIYTYLSSTLSTKGTLQYETKQELHYLGIPINLIVYLWNTPQWSIYATSGGMIEKGLRQYARQEFRNNYNNQNTNTTIKRGIDGVQWSLNTSIGVSYKIHKDLGIFVEPKFSYSFDNNQPISIRTENHSVIGISGGLRFDF